jgi:hypothetical protein
MGFIHLTSQQLGKEMSSKWINEMFETKPRSQQRAQGQDQVQD